VEFIFRGVRATPLRISKRQKQRITPSSGLSATFSPFEGEKGLPETLRKHDDKSLTALPSGPELNNVSALANFFCSG
jgi:hypothetical protein